jgi:hypothetical protein
VTNGGAPPPQLRNTYNEGSASVGDDHPASDSRQCCRSGSPKCSAWHYSGKSSGNRFGDLLRGFSPSLPRKDLHSFLERVVCSYRKSVLGRQEGRLLTYDLSKRTFVYEMGGPYFVVHHFNSPRVDVPISFDILTALVIRVSRRNWICFC